MTIVTHVLPQEKIHHIVIAHLDNSMMDSFVQIVVINVLNVTKEMYVQLVLKEENIQNVTVQQDIMILELLTVLYVKPHVLLVME
jgi:hypothetical protein